MHKKQSLLCLTLPGENIGKKEGHHVLDQLVPHAGAATHGEGLEVGRLDELAVAEESLGLEGFRLLPVVRAEVGEMVVDEDDAVGRHSITCRRIKF